MSFQVNIVQIIAISSVINGLIYSILILFKTENKKANYFLFLLLASICLTFTPYLIGSTYFLDFLWLSWMPLSFAYWIGPSLYFYIIHLTNPAFEFKRKHLIHFFPIALNYLHSIYHALDHVFVFHPIHVAAEVLEFTSLISIFIYSYLSFKILHGYGRAILDQLSNVESVHLRWLKTFIKVLVSLFVIVFGFYLFASDVADRTYSDELLLYRNAVLILYALVVYCLCIGGFKQAQTLNKPIDLRSFNKSDQADELIKQVRKQKLYLDPELTLHTLSRETGISEREITFILNKELDQNFYHFINSHRIEEVKAKLVDPGYKHMKIVSIAYDSGFNSKATFNRLFRQHVGMSPREYRKAVDYQVFVTSET